MVRMAKGTRKEEKNSKNQHNSQYIAKRTNAEKKICNNTNQSNEFTKDH